MLSPQVKISNKIPTQLILSRCFQVIVVALVIVVQGVSLVAAGQALAQTQQSASKTQTSSKPAAKKNFTLRIVKENVMGISLKADKAKLSEIAAELSKKLNARVVLGHSMEKEAITTEFIDLTLDLAVRLLAPRAYIDYEIRADASPVPLGIFLLGNNDPDPAANAVVQGSSQAMLIEGNTEDPEEKTEFDTNDPLQVSLDDNLLTVKSKKQPLALVIMEIADLLGVPAEIKNDSGEIVNTEIKSVPFEDAIPRLSPNVRLYVRADLTKSQRHALRLTITQPPTKATGQ